jgi:SAM-dependent methyltransferase
MSQDTIYTASNLETHPSGIKIQDKVLRIIQAMEVESILDVGCGNGRFGEILRQQGYRYVGLEPAERQIAFLRQTYPDLEVVQATCYDDPAGLDLGRFDLVMSMEVIEHLFDPGRLLAFKRHFVKPGGAILTTTPDYGNYLKNLAISVLNLWDDHHGPLWDGGHIKFFSRKSLAALHARVDLTDLRWDGVAGYRMPLLPMTIVCIARA